MEESHIHKDGKTQDKTECTVQYWTITTRPAKGNKAGSIGRTDVRPVS